MSDWWNEYNSGFVLSALGLILGSISVCFGYMYRSKCSKIKLCCLEVERDTHNEIEIDEFTLTHPSAVQDDKKGAV